MTVPDALGTPTRARPGQARRAEGDPPIALGSVLAARYRLVEFVGVGGMGAVYRARDLTLGADVAVKVLAPDLARDPRRVEYFRNEVKLARRVTHPNVCRLHDLVETEDLWFITMEYVDGETLEARLRDGDRLPVERVVEILRDVAEGLGAAHRASVVHRDLKPANVLLAAGDGRAIVADFGIAAEVNLLGHAVADVAGTRGYMAPEQADGKAVDARTDVYAMGVLAYRMVTGELPVNTPTLEAPDASGAMPVFRGVPDALSAFVERCLEIAPSRRPADASEALALLAGAAPAEAPAPTDRTESVRRAPRPSAIAAAAGAALIAAAALYFGTRSDEPAAPPEPLAVGAIDGAALATEDAWLAEALHALLLEELEDSWGLDARPATPEAGTVTLRLARDRSGRLGIAFGDDREIRADSLAALAGAGARALVEDRVPPPLRRPTDRDLAEAGTSEPEAWRLWRRAKREARMQRWSRMRELAIRAAELDPAFPMSHFELAISYEAGDPSLAEKLARARELAEATPALHPLWRMAIEFVHDNARGDHARAKARLAEVETLDLDERQRLYLETRLAMGYYFGGDRAEAIPRLEWIAEKWPDDAAAPKLLASHFLDATEPGGAPMAAASARRAVSIAPYDAGARADLARALLLAGEREEALGHAAIARRADPEEKRAALAGGESVNSLFALYMALGDPEEAAVHARRLMTGSETERAHARAMLARAALFRGDFDAGLAGLLEAGEASGRLGREFFARRYQREAGWHAMQLGRRAEAIAALSAAGGRHDPAAGVLAQLLEGDAAGARQSASRLDETSEAALVALVILHRTEERWDALLGAYRRLRAMSARTLEVDFFAAEAHEAQGRLDAAEKLYADLADHPEAFTQPILSARALLRLGRLRERAGDPEGAIGFHRRLLARWSAAPPDTPEIAEARRVLAAGAAPAPSEPARTVH